MSENLKTGKQLAEGKTKIIYDLPDEPGLVLVQSKDRITAGDGARAHDLVGKAAISNESTCKVFEYLLSAGIKTHFIRQVSPTAFVAQHCDMVPIEWVTRRVATGSFLKRNPGVKEGFRFAPLKLEIFFKDDANHDPQWSFEQLVDAKFTFGGVPIGQHEIDVMSKTTLAVFEVLEKAWTHLNCSLIDSKIEFGIIPKTGEIVVADIIDSDSWRLWPAGDRRLMKDKQVYRELKEVTPEALEQVKKNFEWISEKLGQFMLKPHAQVVILMGSPSDTDHCEKIRKSCKALGVPCELRITSAHKGSPDTLQIIADYEALNIPTVFIAVAGCSNGLGPVTSGNTSFPVINCPPISEHWGPQDIWSSLHLPSGLGCCTVLSTDGAALCAAQMIALSDHLIWARLRAKQLNTAIGLKEADRKVRNDK